MLSGSICEKSLNGLNGPIDVGVVHVQMRDPALHEGRSVAGRAAGHLDAVLAEVGRESGCDRSVYPREKNVGLRRLGDPERAGMGGCCLGDACRQAPRAFMVERHPVDVVLKRVLGSGCKQTRLAHAASQHLPPASRPCNERR